jgi:hypothetical protein
MRVLLIHPEDSPRRGPWSGQRWDLVVDLGKSSRYSEQAWGVQIGCPVLGADSFRQGVADGKIVRQMFAEGRGRLLDEEGIDWWDLTSLLLAPEALNVLAFARITAELKNANELWSTRPGWPANAMAILLGRTLRSFSAGRLTSVATGIGHYAGLMRRFSVAQIKEIFLDKYDSGYRWRARFAARPQRTRNQVVLLPSAYSNVSRMAADYARMLPRQDFLMVATRQSAKQFTPPENVRIEDLAAYARPGFSGSEIASLTAQWEKLRAELRSSAEFQVLSQAGVLDTVPVWIRDGISARDAWREVLEREPVCGVLCGDDSNLFTRLPVLLAARRKIPTVDFHHGAFDGRYLLKDLPCDVYLAKNSMERDYLVKVCNLPAEKVVIAAPAEARISEAHIPETQVSTASQRYESEQGSLILFSEPYEAGGMRAEEFYRELLPELLRVARENKRGFIIKLHPFESRTQREGLVREILGDDANFVTVVDGPLTAGLIAQAWCGITIESTTVMDCRQNGVCCFLCSWLVLSPYEYAQQYARFGVGEVLETVEQVKEIPSRLSEFHRRPAPTGTVPTPVDPELLQRWLTSGFHEPFRAVREPSGARSAS